MSDKISFLLRISVFSSHVSHILFISVTSSRYMTDFIRPFYSCMLKTLVLECTESRMWMPLFTEPSVSLMSIWTLFTFEKKWSLYWNKVTFSLTSVQGQGTQHPTVKLPLRVFTKKGYTFCSTGLIRFLQKNLIYVSRM